VQETPFLWPVVLKGRVWVDFSGELFYIYPGKK